MGLLLGLPESGQNQPYGRSGEARAKSSSLLVCYRPLAPLACGAAVYQGWCLVVTVRHIRAED